MAAKCRHLPRPVPGEDPFFEDEKFAMNVCNGNDGESGGVNAGNVCPLREKCLVFALINHEGAGVWGGMLYHDRMKMKRNKELTRSDWTWHPPTPKETADEVPSEEPSESLAA